MSGRGGRSPYRGGSGNGNHGEQDRGRGHNYSGAISAAKKELCNALGTSMFDYVQKSTADQTRLGGELIKN